MRNAFGEYHPLVNFIYFACVIGFGMCVMHPLFVILSFLGSAACSVWLSDGRTSRFRFSVILPLLAATMLLNPLFSHRGATILFYLPDGNPMTLESVVFGAAMAMMLSAVVLWFSCYNSVMTSDKFLYLFGKIIPALSLVFSMTLRLVPRAKIQARAIIRAQKGLGMDVRDGTLMDKLRRSFNVLSALFSRMLENAADTADSMRARGYGLKGRTAFSHFQWSRRDTVALCVMIFCAGYVLYGILFGGIQFSYFPTMGTVLRSGYEISAAAAYFLLIILPLGIDITEEFRWKYTQSRI